MVDLSKIVERQMEEFEKERPNILKRFETDPNNMANWFPKVVESGVPYPKTIMVPLGHVEREDLCSVFDGNEYLTFGKEFVERVKKAVIGIGTPCFLRNGVMSHKHDWKNTCYVNDVAKVGSNIISILEMNLMAFGVSQPTCYAVRELIKTVPAFHAFSGRMPITKERRYFIRDGKVVCHHPYWPEEAFENQWTSLISFESSKPVLVTLLKDLNYESPEEIKELVSLSEQVGKVFKGWWSVDWLQDTDGKWWCIDMAMGETSYHWSECSTKGMI